MGASYPWYRVSGFEDPMLLLQLPHMDPIYQQAFRALFVEFWRPVAERTLAGVFFWLNIEALAHPPNATPHVDRETADELAERVYTEVAASFQDDVLAARLRSSAHVIEHVVDVHARTTESAYRYRDFHNHLLENRFCAACVKRLLRDVSLPKGETSGALSWCRSVQIPSTACRAHYDALRRHVEPVAGDMGVVTRGRHEEWPRLGLDELLRRLDVLPTGVAAGARIFESFMLGSVIALAMSAFTALTWPAHRQSFAQADGPRTISAASTPSSTAALGATPEPGPVSVAGSSAQRPSPAPSPPPGGSPSPGAPSPPGTAAGPSEPVVVVTEGAAGRPTIPTGSGTGEGSPGGAPLPTMGPEKQETIRARSKQMEQLAAKGVAACGVVVSGHPYSIDPRSGTISGLFPPEGSNERSQRVAAVLSLAIDSCR